MYGRRLPFSGRQSEGQKGVAYVRQLLETIGMEPERVAMYNLSSGEGPRFVDLPGDDRQDSEARPQPGQVQREQEGKSRMIMAKPKPIEEIY